MGVGEHEPDEPCVEDGCSAWLDEWREEKADRAVEVRCIYYTYRT